MAKFIKCIVAINRLRIEQFDADGKPVIVNKEDMFGTTYKETQEVTYKRGDEISLPEDVIVRLGKSVQMMMVPQVDVPMTPTVVAPPEGEMKDSGKETTISDMIPKDERPKGFAKTTSKGK